MTYKLPERLTQTEYNLLTARSTLMAFWITKQVRHYRLAKKLSQKGLGILLGVTQSTVSEWETGVVMPQLDTMMRLCLVLEIPFSFGEPLDEEADD